MTHVLVVDPNEAFATLLSEELKRQGYNVSLCVSEEEALRTARRNLPDLSLLDMALEDPGAIALAKQLREIDADMRVMLIPLMGEDLSPEAASISVQGVLPKPFFLPELPDRVESALQAPVEVITEELSPEASSIEPDVKEEPVPAPEPEPKPAAVVELGGLEMEEMELEDIEEMSEDEKDQGLAYDAFETNRTEIERVMDSLAQEVGADAVLLTFGGGMLTWVGGLAQGEAESVARAVIHGWRTSAEVARVLGREQVNFEQSIAGDDYMLYALSVEQNALMAVVVRGAAPLGLLRHRARGAAEMIAQLCGA
jgi:DNA-binding response OmpR family regulator/predicted regulator of Ras-like GTPase activity (Roadblock/LC7/MglB family)